MRSVPTAREMSGKRIAGLRQYIALVKAWRLLEMHGCDISVHPVAGLYYGTCNLAVLFFCLFISCACVMPAAAARKRSPRFIELEVFSYYD